MDVKHGQSWREMHAKLFSYTKCYVEMWFMISFARFGSSYFPCISNIVSTLHPLSHQPEKVVSFYGLPLYPNLCSKLYVPKKSG
jgi:hypothetical protein